MRNRPITSIVSLVRILNVSGASDDATLVTIRQQALCGALLCHPSCPANAAGGLTLQRFLKDGLPPGGACRFLRFLPRLCRAHAGSYEPSTCRARDRGDA